MAPHDAATSGRTERDDDATAATGAPMPGVLFGPGPFGTVGRYALIEEIGRGGMGTVVRAYDPKLRREVALKRLALHALGSDGEARLVREAQAMAKLSHPNVVAVYDVETGDEGVTLVMEYVAGTTLRAWLRDRTRTWREVVGLFLQAGEGIAAAHRAGLVHRDFKPGNVLVTPEGRVKVTDFGLAKGDGTGEMPVAGAEGTGTIDPAASSDSHGFVHDGEALTRGGVVMGTPPFMAPEQHVGETPDARADQYAFCVSLWAALTHEAPFSGDARALLDGKMAGPPPWPRGVDVPRPIVAAVERGLSPAPDARWPSMDELLAALAHDPAARRRRTLTLVAGLAVLVVVGGGPFVLKAWTDPPCRNAEDRLEGIWDEARRDEVLAAIAGVEVAYSPATAERVGAHLDEYARSFVAQHTDACEATTLRGEQSATVMDLRMACLAEARQRLRATVDVLARPDRDVVNRAVTLVHGLPALEQCADAADLQSDAPIPNDPALASAVETQRAELARARAMIGVGKYAPALELATAIETAAIELDFGPLVAEAKALHGLASFRAGRYDEAHTILTDALQLALVERESIAASIATDLVIVTADRLMRPEEGAAWASVALGLARARDAGGPLEASANNALGSALMSQGRHEDALAAFQRARSMYERTLGESHPNSAAAVANAAVALKALGRSPEAEVAARRAGELMAIVHGPDHPSVAGAKDTLAGVLLDQGKLDEAEQTLASAVDLRKRSLGPDHPLVAATLDNLGSLLAAAGRLQEAEAAAREAFSIAERTLSPDNPEMALFHTNFGTILAQRGELKEALTHLRRALEIQKRAFSEDHPSTIQPRITYGRLLMQAGRESEAIGEYERAWEVGQSPDVAPAHAARAGLLLADALWSSAGERARAIAVAEAVRDRVTAAALPAESDLGEEVATWLKDHPHAAP